MTAKELRDKLVNVPDDTLVVINDADTQSDLHITCAQMDGDRFSLSGSYADLVAD